MSVHRVQDYYPDCPEVYLVSLARTGDRSAFAEIVRRRQSSVRNLLRRCCNDFSLADDLAQQTFLKVWLNIRKLKNTAAFGAWLRRLAISVWLKHVRKKDALHNAGEIAGTERPQHDAAGVEMDLDSALATLPDHVRLCVVLSYHEGLSHREVAEFTGTPLGTVKTHIRSGAQQLQQLLSAYNEHPEVEKS